MSVEPAAQSAGALAVIPGEAQPARNPDLLKALEAARAINARPHREKPELDLSFVRDVLGKDPAAAKVKQRKLAKLLYEDFVKNNGATPAEIIETNAAFHRLMICTKAAKAPVELAKQGPGLASVIIVAASVADRGLQMADQGIKAAHAAWQRKVDDGTVDAVREQVRARASDLFDLGRSLAQRGWTAAIRRNRSDVS
ncbi:MAG: hypothetical protein ACAI38_25125 [Myxococcota bacterium]|nr:hypothetical protein [Myxococcota bacterium]